ncbi:hypothetical protein SAMN05877753_109101 [Bacillus oleivorans]|uniref:Sporulation protein YpjB n=1 Tax=Bacillus oleivorans TaxID=1448271 RepID=A0A285D3N6_9BACI|nr:hypothetical protein [Bacillus oleivorans]SNX74441.1 hypothetical protein SAMN05877753_109101 [Bacillus oleivorans]
MKIFGISLLMMLLLMTLSLGFDLLQGFDTMTSIHNNLSPFQVMETPEMFIFVFFILVFAIESFLYFYRNRKKLKRDKKNNPAT